MNLPMIEEKQIYIRPLKKNDFKNWNKANKSKEFRFMTGASTRHAPSVKENRKKFNKAISQLSDLHFAIIRKADDKYVGCCWLHKINKRDRNARLAIGLREDFFGQGYGTSAIKCLLKFGFSKLNLHRIELRVLEFNKRAVAAYKKCNFKKEGVLRENAFIEGKYYDDTMMSILKSEWRS